MNHPPPNDQPRRRVEGAKALALAFVLSAETLTRIRNLSMPRYGRLTLPDVNNRLGEVHRLCREWVADINEMGVPMPSKYRRLENKFWTAQGQNTTDPPLNVGIFGDKGECGRWCDRQNETQLEQPWGNGSAGPMRWKPAPIYGAQGLGAPDPKQPIFPERQWDETDDGQR